MTAPPLAPPADLIHSLELYIVSYIARYNQYAKQRWAPRHLPRHQGELAKMYKIRASALLLAGLMAAELSAPAHANVVYTLDFKFGSTDEGTGALTLNFNTVSQTFNINESLSSILVSITTPNLDGEGIFTITPSDLNSGSNIDTGSIGQIFSLTAEQSGTSASLYLDLFTNSWQVHNACCGQGATAAQGTFTITGPALAATPLPAALPLFAGGLGFLGYLTRRRKRGANGALAA